MKLSVLDPSETRESQKGGRCKPEDPGSKLTFLRLWGEVPSLEVKGHMPWWSTMERKKWHAWVVGPGFGWDGRVLVVVCLNNGLRRLCVCLAGWHRVLLVLRSFALLAVHSQQ
jgi:hypothetical protein